MSDEILAEPKVDSQFSGSIRILLEITDAETVAAYSECEKSFISDDLRNGNLITMCDVALIELNTTNESPRLGKDYYGTDNCKFIR